MLFKFHGKQRWHSTLPKKLKRHGKLLSLDTNAVFKTKSTANRRISELKRKHDFTVAAKTFSKRMKKKMKTRDTWVRIYRRVFYVNSIIETIGFLVPLQVKFKKNSKNTEKRYVIYVEKKRHLNINKVKKNGDVVPVKKIAKSMKRMEKLTQAQLKAIYEGSKRKRKKK